MARPLHSRQKGGAFNLKPPGNRAHRIPACTASWLVRSPHRTEQGCDSSPAESNLRHIPGALHPSPQRLQVALPTPQCPMRAPCHRALVRNLARGFGGQQPRRRAMRTESGPLAGERGTSGALTFCASRRHLSPAHPRRAKRCRPSIHFAFGEALRERPRTRPTRPAKRRRATGIQMQLVERRGSKGVRFIAGRGPGPSGLSRRG